MNKMDLSRYVEKQPHRFSRIIWAIVNATIFRCLPTKYLRKARIALLLLFGADVSWNAMVYNSCKIYAPWNLKIGDFACVGPNTQLYSKDRISIGNNTIISQGSFLCTAGHDISDAHNALKTAPIELGDSVWVAAEAFVGMGVTIGEGAVVGARAAVFNFVKPWTVVGGNPAKYIKERVIDDK